MDTFRHPGLGSAADEIIEKRLVSIGGGDIGLGSARQGNGLRAGSAADIEDVCRSWQTGQHGQRP